MPSTTQQRGSPARVLEAPSHYKRTNIYLHADMSHKQRAIDRTKPLAAKPGRYRPPDALLAFLQAL